MRPSERTELVRRAADVLVEECVGRDCGREPDRSLDVALDVLLDLAEERERATVTRIGVRLRRVTDTDPGPVAA